MTREGPNATRPERTSRPGRTTRRGFLALAGAAALAGCSTPGDMLGSDEPKIDGGAIRDALERDPPTVPETIPVDVEQKRLDETAERARNDLSSVPAPFDVSEIPNGRIRADLNRMHEDATAELGRAQSADSPAESMDRLRGARARAREVAAAWEAIDAGLTRDDVRETIPEVRDDFEAFRRRWRYVGDEPIRAVLAHAHVEDLVASAGRRLGSAGERHRGDPEGPLSVGAFAGWVERARAALDDAEYVYDRYRSSLDAARGVGEGLKTAGESLVETVDERRSELPNGTPGDPSSFVERDVEGTPAGYALSDLYQSIDYAHRLEDERATGQRANVVLSAHETLVRVRAFESLRERVERGDHATVEDASDVRAIREAAIDAVEEAAAADAHPRLDRRILRVARDFEYVDRELARYDEGDRVSPDSLVRDLGDYVLVETIARATPPTSATVADAIETHL